MENKIKRTDNAHSFSLICNHDIMKHKNLLRFGFQFHLRTSLGPLSKGDFSMYNKVLHISDNDLDGVACFMLSSHCFSELDIDVKRFKTFSRNPEKLIRKVVEKEWDTDSLLFITDTVISDVELAELINEKTKTGHHIRFVDHHTSSLWLNKYNWATVVAEENGKRASAASLLFDMLADEFKLKKNDFLIDFIELVRLYDTWEWFDKGIEKNGAIEPNFRAKHLNDFFFMVRIQEFEGLFDDLHLSGANVFEFPQKIQYLLAIEENRISAYLKRKKGEVKSHLCDIGHHVYSFGIVSAESYASELGNHLCEAFVEHDFIAIVDIGKKKIRLRSRKDNIDVEKIAAIFGGGGHPKASGLDLNTQTTDIFLAPLMAF